MNYRHAILLIFLASLVNACAATQIAVVEKNRIEIDNAFSVDPQIIWSEFQGTSISSNGHVWTVDGLFLQRLDLFGGIEPGEALFEPSAVEEESLPKFRDDMRASDIQELVVASLTQLGYADVVTKNLRPADFGSIRGFRFELSMATESGLDMKGLAVGASVGGSLNLILYIGTRLHYYDAHLPTVEKIIQSIELL